MAARLHKKKPGYYNDKPLLPSITELRKVIGIQDSCIQTSQVSLLHLEDEANKSDDVDGFINGLFDKFKISKGTKDFELYKRNQYRIYILQTYNVIESSLKSLIADYRLYNNRTDGWKVKSDDKALDPLNQLIENLDPVRKSSIKKYPEYFLVNYYRLIRNSVVHLQNDEAEHTKTSKYYNENVGIHLRYFVESYSLEAPNSPAEISFDDFMLYTREIKYFGNLLNDECFPSESVLAIVSKRDEELQRKLKQTQQVSSDAVLLSRINTLRSYFHKNFGNSHKEIRDEFCRHYLTNEGTEFLRYL